MATSASSPSGCGIIGDMDAAPLNVWTNCAQPAPLAALREFGLSITAADANKVSDADAADNPDAVLWWAEDQLGLQALLDQATLPSSTLARAWVVVCAAPESAALDLALLQRGVEAVISSTEPAEIARALRQAFARKHLEIAARTAYATDLATGLPHQAQLLEHMTQLLALREREPAPMVLMVLRVQGFEQAAARLGSEAGNVLRRKVAVRLRSALRASDVVASMSADAFGVLLGRLENKADGERVAAKLVRTLHQPFKVAGQSCPVSAAVGMALYPEHGKDARSLLQRASAQAGSVAMLGQEGMGGSVHRLGPAAANDEGVDPAA